MKCNSNYHTDICPARRRNGDCVSEYPCRHKVEPPKPKTNADRIRSMTDEELADFLCDATYKENEQAYPIMRTVNKVWWHKWLKQPYKEDL